MLSATKRLLFVRLQKQILGRSHPQNDKAWLKTNGSPMVRRRGSREPVISRGAYRTGSNLTRLEQELRENENIVNWP
jgi:hypothetical protein